MQSKTQKHYSFISLCTREYVRRQLHFSTLNLKPRNYILSPPNWFELNSKKHHCNESLNRYPTYYGFPATYVYLELEHLIGALYLTGKQNNLQPIDAAELKNK